MKIGYACICNLDETTKMRTCIMKNASEERLYTLIQHNLFALEKILVYNHQQGIQMFRISSDIIPFGSSPVNTLDWQHVFASSFQHLGTFIKTYGLRVSFHPGQYTLLNSPRNEVVKRSIDDLLYHAAVLDCMGLDDTHKMVLHVGGLYGDKTLAMQRFQMEYQRLPSHIQKRLIIENDDRYYNFEDVFTLGSNLQIPVVFDNLHHQILHTDADYDDITCLALAKQTWKSKDGIQKMHYSLQDPSRRIGAHAVHVDVENFVAYTKALQRLDIDIMLEVKDKQISAIDCVQALKQEGILV